MSPAWRGFLQLASNALKLQTASSVQLCTQAIPRHARFGWLSKSAIAGSAAGFVAWHTSEDIPSFVTSLERTRRAAWWSIESAVLYKWTAVSVGKEADNYPEALSGVHKRCAEQLLQLCKRNGGVYIKAGQLLTTVGAIPKEYQEILVQLQDRADPIPVSGILQVIEEDLGIPADKVFLDFALEATAAASIAQVHRATLHSGQQVAVKVQYPSVRATATSDLATLSLISDAASWLFPEYQLQWLVSELQGKLTKELDFAQEVDNAERLRGMLGGGQRVVVPQVHHELSSSRVITMEWVAGCKINDTDALRKQCINPRQVGLDLLAAFAEMTYVHGLVHGDPHPGNILVRSKGPPRWLNWLLRGSLQHYEIVLLDHGTYLEMDPVLRRQYCRLWCAFVIDDVASARKVACEMAGERAGMVLPVVLTSRAKTREERKLLRQAAGINSLGDLTQILAGAPRGLVEALRISAVVRGVAALLGATLSDRLRINGMFALRGLPEAGESFRERCRVVLYKSHVRLKLWGIRALLRGRDTLARAYAMLVYWVKDADVLTST